MASIPHSDDHRRRLIPLCQELGAGLLPFAFARHLARVLMRVVAPESLGEIDAPPKVLAAFRSKGLIPEPFIALCEATLGAMPDIKLSAEALAVCFAAAAYPQRAHQKPVSSPTDWASESAAAIGAAPFAQPDQAEPPPAEAPAGGEVAEAAAENAIDDETLKMRVQSFARHFSALSSFTPNGAAAWLRSTDLLPEDFALDEIAGLLGDLTATDRITTSAGPYEGEERVCGAAFYLSSCHPESIARICKTWRAEAAFVRFVRGQLMSPPSEITGDASYGAAYPLWTRIRNGLEGKVANAPPGHFEYAISLEQSAWKQARLPRQRQRFSERDIPELLARFWAAHHDKLISGFPYYAFRSRFGRWWRQCAINWWMEARPESSAPPPVQPISRTISPHFLRNVREGYRLVRTTIFKRPQPSAPDLNQTAMIETQRRAADEIFHYHIAEGVDGARLRDRLREVAARYPELGEHAINDLSVRLRARLRAYLLARMQPWSNVEIGAQKSAVQRRGAGRTLGQEPGVFTLTSLARLVPEDRTLLWVFTAHVFLRPLIDPPHADSWSFARYLRELWWWLGDAQFEAAVRRAAAAGSRADLAACQAMQAPPLRDLIATLKSFQTEGEVENYLSAADPQPAEAAARQQVEALVGGGATMAETTARMRTWRKQAALHWIVPVWYLVFVERLGADGGDPFDTRKLTYRLIVDPDEAETVIGLYDAMAGCRRKSVDR